MRVFLAALLASAASWIVLGEATTNSSQIEATTSSSQIEAQIGCLKGGMDASPWGGSEWTHWLEHVVSEQNVKIHALEADTTSSLGRQQEAIQSGSEWTHWLEHVVSKQNVKIHALEADMTSRLGRQQEAIQKLEAAVARLSRHIELMYNNDSSEAAAAPIDEHTNLEPPGVLSTLSSVDYNDDDGAVTAIASVSISLPRQSVETKTARRSGAGLTPSERRDWVHQMRLRRTANLVVIARGQRLEVRDAGRPDQRLLDHIDLPSAIRALRVSRHTGDETLVVAEMASGRAAVLTLSAWRDTTTTTTGADFETQAKIIDEFALPRFDDVVSPPLANPSQEDQHAYSVESFTERADGLGSSSEPVTLTSSCVYRRRFQKHFVLGYSNGRLRSFARNSTLRWQFDTGNATISVLAINPATSLVAFATDSGIGFVRPARAVAMRHRAVFPEHVPNSTFVCGSVQSMAFDAVHHFLLYVGCSSGKTFVYNTLKKRNGVVLPLDSISGTSRALFSVEGYLVGTANDNDVNEPSLSIFNNSGSQARTPVFQLQRTISSRNTTSGASAGSGLLLSVSQDPYRQTHIALALGSRVVVLQSHLPAAPKDDFNNEWFHAVRVPLMVAAVALVVFVQVRRGSQADSSSKFTRGGNGFDSGSFASFQREMETSLPPRLRRQLDSFDASNEFAGLDAHPLDNSRSSVDLDSPVPTKVVSVEEQQTPQPKARHSPLAKVATPISRFKALLQDNERLLDNGSDDFQSGVDSQFAALERSMQSVEQRTR